MILHESPEIVRCIAAGVYHGAGSKPTLTAGMQMRQALVAGLLIASVALVRGVQGRVRS
jgi:hypothetical protein